MENMEIIVEFGNGNGINCKMLKLHNMPSFDLHSCFKEKTECFVGGQYSGGPLALGTGIDEVTV